MFQNFIYLLFNSLLVRDPTFYHFMFESTQVNVLIREQNVEIRFLRRMISDSQKRKNGLT